MRHLPTVLQIAGLALFVCVAFWLFPPAGFVVLGIELVYVGHILEETDAGEPPT